MFQTGPVYVYLHTLVCYRYTMSANITGIGVSWGVAVTSAGLLISEKDNHRVIHVRRDGSRLAVIGSSRGSGREQFWYPYGVAVQGNTAWVADSANNRLVRLVISLDGSLTWVAEVEELGGMPHQITLCGDMVYATLWLSNEVVEVNGTSVIRRHLTPAQAAGRYSDPQGITCSPDNR
jgi:hypothetical protein